MKLLIKLGGTLLDAPESRARLASEIAMLEHAVVVVHGGGKQMTRYLAERNIESRFVNGLRVTTPEVVDAVLKVFAGTVNTELVGALRAAGAGTVTSRHPDRTIDTERDRIGIYSGSANGFPRGS